MCQSPRTDHPDAPEVGGTTPDAAALHEIVDGVFAWIQPDGTWWVNNAGAIHGGGGVIVVDTCATEQRTGRFLAAVAAATGDAPIPLAINTHQHGDHTYGNSLLPATTTIVGHELMRAGLADDPLIDGCPPLWFPVPDWGRVERRLPSASFSDALTLHSGTRRVEVRHPGFTAHTAGDVVAWLPEERVLFTGDLIFHGLTPLVFMGSVDGARRALEWLAAFGPAHLVPGHGPLVTGGEVDGVLDDHDRYYRFVDGVARAGLAADSSPLEACRRTDLGEFAAWADSERLVLNVHRAYADAHDRELDLLQAFADAIDWHGGPLATSV